MTKARLSIGTDTPSGEPANGPTGPYVTDEHDDEVAAAKRRPASDPNAKRRQRRADPSRNPDDATNRRAQRHGPIGRRKRPASP